MIEILGLAVMGVMIASWHSVIQGLKDLLKLENYRYGWVLSCPKCVSFWLGLAVTQDIFKASIIAFLGFLISHIIDRIDLWYEK